MALLKIIKLSSKTWKHNSDVDEDFILTKFYAKQEDNNFLLVESYGSKRRKYLINEIEVYDIGGGAETFANFEDLFLRLELLKYPAFYIDGEFVFNPASYDLTEFQNTNVNPFVRLDAIIPKDIDTLPAATTPLAGTEPLIVLQDGMLKKIAASDLGGGGATQYPKVICFQRNNLPNLTGTTTITKLGSFTILANTIPSDCVIRMTLRMTNSGTANTKFVYTTWNSINAGVNIFTNYVTFTNATRPELLLRRLGYVSGGNFESLGVVNIYDEIGSTAAYQSFAFDVTVDNEIDIWGKLSDASDTLIFNTLILEISA